MKNTKVQLLKKGFNNICQKLKRKTGKIIEPKNEKQHDYYSIKSIKCNESSSGYASGGSEEIYEQNNNNNNELIDVDAHLLKTNNKTKLDLIKYLLDHEIIYINSIQNGLENFIRPLMAVIDNKLYFQIFQNIEKINSMSKFIQSKIIESYNINGDFVESTIDVIYEYVSIFLCLFL
jgi:hypothetical protein